MTPGYSISVKETLRLSMKLQLMKHLEQDFQQYFDTMKGQKIEENVQQYTTQHSEAMCTHANPNDDDYSVVHSYTPSQKL